MLDLDEDLFHARLQEYEESSEVPVFDSTRFLDVMVQLDYCSSEPPLHT